MGFLSVDRTTNLCFYRNLVMDQVWQANVSATPPDAPSTPLVGYPKAGAQPTEPGPWWYYAMTEEVRNVIVQGGLTPNGTSVNQLASAIVAIVKQLSPANTYIPVRVCDTVGVTRSGIQTVDGVIVATGDRVLCASSLATDMGIFIVDGAGAWVRSDDFALSSIQVEGKSVTVAEGNIYSGTLWVLDNPAGKSVTVGSDAIEFKDITGPKQKAPTSVSAGTYTQTALDQTLLFTTTCIVTLLPANKYTGKRVVMNALSAVSVTSASNDVIPLGSSVPGNRLLVATQGKFIMLESDGAYWRVIIGN